MENWKVYEIWNTETEKCEKVGISKRNLSGYGGRWYDHYTKKPQFNATGAFIKGQFYQRHECFMHCEYENIPSRSEAEKIEAVLKYKHGLSKSIKRESSENTKYLTKEKSAQGGKTQGKKEGAKLHTCQFCNKETRGPSHFTHVKYHCDKNPNRKNLGS